jgi:hypothetical protein
MATTLIRTLLGTDPGLNAEGITLNRIYITHDVDTPGAKPFIVLRWGNTDPGLGPINRRSLQVWVHDKKGDYSRINRCLKHVRDALIDLAGIATPETSGWLSQVNWEGYSEDLSDDEANTFTRYASFVLTGSGVS